MNINKKNQLIVSALILFAFGIGLVSGNIFTKKKLLLNNDGFVEISKVVDLYSKTRSSDISFNQFWGVWDKIKQNYVDHPVDEVDLFYGAISGLVQGLDDPYSVYFPPKEAEQFSKDLSGKFDGIGAEIGIKDEVLTIVTPLPESPAEQAGLLAGDKIVAIDQESSAGLNIDEAVSKIRGEKGTKVVLTVLREENDVADITITRGTISTPTVKFEQKENGVAYIRIYYFNEHTANDFSDIISDIVKKDDVTGLVIDMRRNPGGLLRTSVEVASEWLGEGDVVVKESYNNGRKNEYQSSGKHRLKDIKTMVLIDKGTASGAEIVAGALQDYGKATVIGQVSYGKGSVQDFEVLPDGSALKLTVAKWFTPLERSIDKEGITPDVILDDMYDEKYLENKQDIALDKALELLK